MKEKNWLNKILFTILIFLSSIIIFSTILFFAGKTNHNQSKKKSSVVVARGQAEVEKEFSSFNELGRIRTIPAKSDGSQTLIITAWFSYTKNDVEFHEELARKSKEIKNTIIKYVSSHTKEELQTMGEKKVKEELKYLINNLLVLNKIQEIYFSEYIFLG